MYYRLYDLPAEGETRRDAQCYAFNTSRHFTLFGNGHRVNQEGTPTQLRSARGSTGIRRPFSNVNTKPRHSMRFTAKLATHTKNMKKS
jgi:hypothetical protein